MLAAQDRNTEARKLLEKALRIARDRRFTRHTLMIEGNIGELLVNEKELDRAESLLRGVLQRARRNNAVGILPEAYRRMARVALEQGSSRSFNIYARKAKEAALAVGEKHELNHIERLKARYYASRDMFEKAEEPSGKLLARLARTALGLKRR